MQHVFKVEGHIYNFPIQYSYQTELVLRQILHEVLGLISVVRAYSYGADA